ncbi:MAG: superoxide dismutase, Ni [Actinobacteria bacterium]|nr:superoxide dismutase, Ni [Actinomycetota bacterium]
MTIFRPAKTARAHCDLMCGVYDPAQARIEAQSVLRACEKYQASDDPVFRERCVIVKEERAELVKHHLWVLWTDFFKPHHLEAFKDLHDAFWTATKAAGAAKKSMAPADAEALITAVERVSSIFWQTEESAAAGLFPPSE